MTQSYCKTYELSAYLQNERPIQSKPINNYAHGLNTETTHWWDQNKCRHWPQDKNLLHHNELVSICQITTKMSNLFWPSNHKLILNKGTPQLKPNQLHASWNLCCCPVLRFLSMAYTSYFSISNTFNTRVEIIDLYTHPKRLLFWRPQHNKTQDKISEQQPHDIDKQNNTEQHNQAAKSRNKNANKGQQQNERSVGCPVPVWAWWRW